MYRQLLTILLSLVTNGCSDSAAPDAMDHDTACHEQADAWCDAAGFASSQGCRSFYVHECEPAGPRGAPVAMDAQNACLQAIADTVTVSDTAEPAACVETW